MADSKSLFDRAEAAWRAGNMEDARTFAEQVLERDPVHAGALMILTNLCFSAGDIAGAAPYLQRLAALFPDDIMIRNNLGRALLASEHLGDAAQAFGKVLAAEPDNARALDGLGIVRHRQGAYDDAAGLHAGAIRVEPEFAAGWCNLGIALTDLARFDDAAATLDRALALDPDDARTRFNRAILHLSAGDWHAGWPLYESRLAFLGGEMPPGRRWQGELLSGERILLIPEQGFGDFIQFTRFAERVQERGGAPVLAVPKALKPLIAAQDWSIDHCEVDTPEDTPLWCPLMSLGPVLDLAPGDVSGGAYLRAPSGPATHAEGAILRVGLAWAGSPAHRRDRERSLRLADLAPLFDVPDVSFVNLQVGLRPADAEEMAGRPGLFAETPDLGDFAATADVIAGLDLVISADTAVLHLAGAMGCSVWGLLPLVADWRWGRDGMASPWYDSLRLYRQSSRGDWKQVAATVADDLRGLARR
ncbi:MAG: tetratricopeptide repeat protein [Rhodospirillales bacterium]